MSEISANVEQKIIEAAIDCIEKYGLQGTTIRKIAETAGVNLAAINYYFRSKEALIQRVMQVTLENAFDWGDFSQFPSQSPQEKCVAIFETLIQGACRYPGMTRFHFGEVIEGKEPSITLDKFNGFFNDLMVSLQKDGVKMADGPLKLAIAEMTSSALMMALVPSLFEKSLGIDLKDEGMRKVFLARLVERLLGE